MNNCYSMHQTRWITKEPNTSLPNNDDCKKSVSLAARKWTLSTWLVKPKDKNVLIQSIVLFHQVLTSTCAVISVIACDRENLGVLTDYDVVSHLAYLTNKVCLATTVWQSRDNRDRFKDKVSLCYRRISGCRFSTTKNNETTTEIIKWGIHDEHHNINDEDRSSSSSSSIITIVNN